MPRFKKHANLSSAIKNSHVKIAIALGAIKVTPGTVAGLLGGAALGEAAGTQVGRFGLQLPAILAGLRDKEKLQVLATIGGVSGGLLGLGYGARAGYNYFDDENT